MAIFVCSSFLVSAQFELERFIGEKTDKFIIFYVNNAAKGSKIETDSDPMVVTISMMNDTITPFNCSNDSANYIINVYQSKAICDSILVKTGSVQCAISIEEDILKRNKRKKWISNTESVYVFSKPVRKFKDIDDNKTYIEFHVIYTEYISIFQCCMLVKAGRRCPKLDD